MKKIKIKLLLSLTAILLAVSCNIAPEQTRDTSQNFETLDNGYAYIMLDNPVVTNSKKAQLPLDPKSFFSSIPQFITPHSTLKYDCEFNGVTVNSCIRSLADISSTTPISRDGDSWSKDSKSSEYLQVHTLFHAKKLIERFYSAMTFTKDYLATRPQPFTTAPSFPLNNFESQQLFWLGLSSAPQQSSKTLDLITFCPNNSDGTPSVAYIPASRKLCLGSRELFNSTGFHFAQDPEVIYHEMGHVMVDIMMNYRNGSSVVKSDLGLMAYDEAGAINEGIADYFAYIMTDRDRFAEWGLGQGLTLAGFESALRPITDDDPVHISGISSAPTERLSYPQYINYNANHPEGENEDIHNSGQIISHYLVSLTKDLKTSCSITQEKAENYVIMTLSETLAEMGDLTSLGSDLNSSFSTFFTNLSPLVSYDWFHTTQPINYKRFFQTFAKHTLHNITTDLCTAYSKNLLEANLDHYGLLLFSDYNDRGVSTNGISISDVTSDVVVPLGTILNPLMPATPALSSTTVNILNRVKTTLVSKTQLSLPALEDTRSQVYLIDSITGVNNLIAGRAFQGTPLALTVNSDLAGTRYNNDNRFFSPGEVVGFSLNLINNSNIPLAGVQVLANDWDHMKKQSPADAHPKFCTYDGFPSTAAGGVEDINVTPAPGDCKYPSRGTTVSPLGLSYNYVDDSAQPVCFVQKVDGEQTTWITQNEYRQYPTLGLSTNECLGPQGSQNPNECLVRIVPGGDNSVFSKIDPSKTWAETMFADQTNPVFTGSGFIIMELSKWIPQGTLFNCRMRVRFSNCSDCFQDQNNESYSEYEYSGNEPYKIINFQFRVVN